MIDSLSGWLDKGAIGIMGICLILSYYLLVKEQKREGTGRKTILNSIYVFMGFSLVVGVLAILLESRSGGTADDKSDELLRSVISQLRNQDAGYIFKSSGQLKTEGIKIETPDSNYVFFNSNREKSDFSEYKRDFSITGNDQVQVMLDTGFSLGYLDNDRLTSELVSPVSESNYSKGTFQEVYGLYTTKKGPPFSVRLGISSKNDLKKFFFDLLNDDNGTVEVEEKRAAIKGLSNLLEALEAEEYQALIQVLNSNTREIPYRYWELAQVCEGYAKHIEDSDDMKNMRRNAYRDYVNWYMDNRYNLPSDSVSLKKWYTDIKYWKADK